MTKLTAYERAFIQSVLKQQLRQTEDYVKENSNTLEAFLAQNESIPLLKSIIEKLDAE